MILSDNSAVITTDITAVTNGNNNKYLCYYFWPSQVFHLTSTCSVWQTTRASEVRRRIIVPTFPPPVIDDRAKLTRSDRDLPGQTEPVRPLQEHQCSLSAALQHPGGVVCICPKQRVQVSRGGRRQGRRGSVLRQQGRFPHWECDLGEDVVPRVGRSPRGPGDGRKDPERCVSS